MSKRSKRHASPTTTPSPGLRRSTWLGLALLAVTSVAVVSIIVWTIQRNDAASAQTPPALTVSDGAAAANGPRIAVDQDAFDYGDVKLNSTIETVVRVRNTGSQPLALDPEPVVELVEGC